MERGYEVISRLYPYEEVDIFMVTSRLAEEEVDCPAPSKPEIDTCRRRDVTDFGDGDKLRVSAFDDPTPLTCSVSRHCAALNSTPFDRAQLPVFAPEGGVVRDGDLSPPRATRRVRHLRSALHRSRKRPAVFWRARPPQPAVRAGKPARPHGALGTPHLINCRNQPGLRRTATPDGDAGSAGPRRSRSCGRPRDRVFGSRHPGRQRHLPIARRPRATGSSA